MRFKTKNQCMKIKFHVQLHWKTDIARIARRFPLEIEPRGIYSSRTSEFVDNIPCTCCTICPGLQSILDGNNDYHQFSLPHLYIFSLEGWENVLFELESEGLKHGRGFSQQERSFWSPSGWMLGTTGCRHLTPWRTDFRTTRFNTLEPRTN